MRHGATPQLGDPQANRSNDPILLNDRKGFESSTHSIALRLCGRQIAQQEAPDTAVFSKWETGEVGQAVAGRILKDQAKTEKPAARCSTNQH